MVVFSYIMLLLALSTALVCCTPWPSIEEIDDGSLPVNFGIPLKVGFRPQALVIQNQLMVAHFAGQVEHRMTSIRLAVNTQADGYGSWKTSTVVVDVERNSAAGHLDLDFANQAPGFAEIDGKPAFVYAYHSLNSPHLYFAIPSSFGAMTWSETKINLNMTVTRVPYDILIDNNVAINQPVNVYAIGSLMRGRALLACQVGTTYSSGTIVAAVSPHPENITDSELWTSFPVFNGYHNPIIYTMNNLSAIFASSETELKVAISTQEVPDANSWTNYLVDSQPGSNRWIISVATVNEKMWVAYATAAITDEIKFAHFSSGQWLSAAGFNIAKSIYCFSLSEYQGMLALSFHQADFHLNFAFRKSSGNWEMEVVSNSTPFAIKPQTDLVVVNDRPLIFFCTGSLYRATNTAPPPTDSPTASPTVSVTTGPTNHPTFAPTPRITYIEPDYESIAFAVGGSVGGIMLMGSIIAVAIQVIARRRLRGNRSTKSNSSASMDEILAGTYSTPSQPSGPHYSNPPKKRSTNDLYSLPPVPGSSKFVIADGDIVRGKKLGEGSFGVVLMGKWHGTDVAIKEVKSMDPAQRDALFKEAESMKQLRPHKNIVQFYGVCTKPHLALVVEFCAGGSLDEALYSDDVSKRRQFEPAAKQRIAMDVCRGLFHLHCEGMIHRDLAARNVLLDEADRGKVADFGMARGAGADEATGKNYTATTIGPIKWMAPEQMNRQAYSFASDVWSLGVVFFELYSSSPPWPDSSNMEAATAVMGGQRLAVPQQSPNAIGVAMTKCFAFSPDRRPSIQDLMTVLEHGDWDSQWVSDGNSDSVSLDVSSATEMLSEDVSAVLALMRSISVGDEDYSGLQASLNTEGITQAADLIGLSFEQLRVAPFNLNPRIARELSAFVDVFARAQRAARKKKQTLPISRSSSGRKKSPRRKKTPRNNSGKEEENEYDQPPKRRE